ncbi:MAG: hypothetical protein ACR2M1_06870 [Gemmatimonadaceae bacterium]
MKQSLSVLLSGTVDYAGLFPPAALDMGSAVAAYADYLRDPARFMLGRFIVPVARLREFDEAAAAVLPHRDVAGAENPWHISALTGPDLSADIDLALKFNCRHWSGSEIGHADIDTLEIRAQSRAEIGSAMSAMPSQFTTYFEIPIETDPAELLGEIRRTGARAKARTGGVTADAFPAAQSVARFMLRCRDERVAFKLTAGLHHPMRGTHRLTYAPAADLGDMFGYLNAFVAAALAWDGAGEVLLVHALSTRDVHEFEFADDGFSFRGHHVTLGALRDARSNFIASFGSCSFREPVDELAALSLS